MRCADSEHFGLRRPTRARSLRSRDQGRRSARSVPFGKVRWDSGSLVFLPKRTRNLNHAGQARPGSAAHDGPVWDQATVQNREKYAHRRLVRGQIKNRPKKVECEIGVLDADADKPVTVDEELARRTEVLALIAGVLPVVAGAMAAGCRNWAWSTSAPRPTPIGFIDGARIERVARPPFYSPRAVAAARPPYMATFAAIRHNLDLSRKYRSSVGPSKAALRKLAVCWPRRCWGRAGCGRRNPADTGRIQCMESPEGSSPSASAGWIQSDSR